MVTTKTSNPLQLCGLFPRSDFQPMTRFAAFYPSKKREELLLFGLRAFVADRQLRIDFLNPNLGNPQSTDLDRNAYLTQQFDLILTPFGSRQEFDLAMRHESCH